MKNKKNLIFIIFNLLVIAYLAYPLPKTPDLYHSIKSTEPGDTTQLKNVKAFYNNLQRADVIDFYVKNYQNKHPLAIKLNHPPEKAKTIIKDTIQTYYLEEIIIPFKQSLFINGFNWQKDVFTKESDRPQNKMTIDGIDYTTKITLKTYTSNILASYLIILLGQLTLIFAINTYKQVFRSKHD